jgi:hypothetical protein
MPHLTMVSQLVRVSDLRAVEDQKFKNSRSFIHGAAIHGSTEIWLRRAGTLNWDDSAFLPRLG